MIDAIRVKFKALRSEKRYSPLVRLAAFAYRHTKQLRTLPLLPAVVGQLNKWHAAKEDTDRKIPSALDTAFAGLHHVIRPLQNRSEIEGLLRLLAPRKPKFILEIGTANGGTLFLYCQVADPEAVVISVDLPGGWFGGGYPAWKSLLYRKFVSRDQRLHLLRADSHSAKTFSRVRQLLNGRKLDFMFIDGDHTYEGVKQDYLKYRELCAPDAVIGFHDIVPNAADPDCEVPRFWDELKSQNRTEEFVENPAQEGAGIGVILSGTAPAPPHA
jgi:predicted O-methyltransferase YrrM